MQRPEVKDIHAVLQEHWGFHAFRPLQEEVVRSVLAGRDTLALLPTGGGKSLCFQVPAMALGRLCLVVSPLIALMKDQVERLRSKGIAARAVVSGMSHAEIDNALESAAVGRLSFLYVSPERLASELFQARLHRLPLGLIAVDEAHCISQWGYDFRPAYLQVGALREQMPHVPVLALTATATERVSQDIMERLHFKAPHVLRGSFHRPELAFWVSRGEDRHGRLLRILAHLPGSSIIYMRDRRGTMQMARFLQHHGISAAAYHAGMGIDERDRVQQEWTTGAVRCVAATNAFGMGIDKPDVRTVVHLDLPPDLESYYQEAGRAGRDGRPAYAFLLTGPGDAERLRERVMQGFPSLADIRRTYQSFADLHGIALGAGAFETYELDLAALAQRTGLKALTVTHALKALELDGCIALSDGMRSPSRVLIIAGHHVVYHLRVNDRRMAPLLEALLRLYGGLFEEPVIIDELRLARLTEWSRDTVIARLHELDRQRVLSYRPRSDTPSVTLLRPRQDAQRLTIDPAALRDRETRAVERLGAMVRYADSNDRCRARILLDHFNEPPGQDCGQCDVCRAVRVYRVPATPSDLLTAPPPDLSFDPQDLRRELDEDLAREGAGVRR